jgi:hypothetical protein
MTGGTHMRKLARTVTISGVALLFSSSLALVGCSSSPSQEEMNQLNNLKGEVASLQKEISAKEQQKAAIEKTLAEKGAKLKKCADDQQIVKQRLAAK